MLRFQPHFIYKTFPLGPQVRATCQRLTIGLMSWLSTSSQTLFSITNYIFFAFHQTNICLLLPFLLSYVPQKFFLFHLRMLLDSDLLVVFIKFVPHTMSFLEHSMFLKITLLEFSTLK